MSPPSDSVLYSSVVDPDWKECGNTIFYDPNMECCNPSTNAAGPACCGQYPWSGNSSVCCDYGASGSYLFEGIEYPQECPKGWPSACKPGEFMMCSVHDHKEFYEECEKYLTINDKQVGESLGSGKELAGFGCCDQSIFARYFIAGISGAKVKGKDTNQCPVPRQLSTVEDDMDLFARLNRTHCAERLPFGPEQSFRALTKGADLRFKDSKLAYFCTDCDHGSEWHDKWLQVVSTVTTLGKTQTEVFRIVWNFRSGPKSMVGRFDNAYKNGEAVEWTITTFNPTKVVKTFNGTWYFSESFHDSTTKGYLGTNTGDGSAIGLGFSPNDGLWGAGSCVDTRSTGNQYGKPGSIQRCPAQTTGGGGGNGSGGGGSGGGGNGSGGGGHGGGGSGSGSGGGGSGSGGGGSGGGGSGGGGSGGGGSGGGGSGGHSEQHAGSDHYMSLVDFWGIGNFNKTDEDASFGCGNLYFGDMTKKQNPAAIMVEMYSNRVYTPPTNLL